MANLSFRVFIATAAIVGTAPALASPKEEAYAVVEKWAASANAFDAEQTAATYAPNATIHTTAGQTLTTGADAILAYFKGIAARKIQVKLQDWSAVELSPDAVAIAGFYEVSIPGDGQPTLLPARYSFAVFKRDGAWKIGHHHSSPRPRPPQ